MISGASANPSSGHKTPNQAPSCSVDLRCSLVLLSTIQLRGTLPGLRQDPTREGIAIDPSFFPCCAGSGLRGCDEAGSSSGSSRQYNHARRCDLYSRLNAVQHALNRIGRGSADLPALTVEHEKEALRFFSAVSVPKRSSDANNFIPSQRVFDLPVHLDSIQTATTWCVVAEWRFGLRCEALDLRHALSDKPILSHSLKPTQAIVVIGLNKLADPYALDYFERVVSDLYDRDGMLFFGDRQHLTKTKMNSGAEPKLDPPFSNSFSTKGAFSKKIRALQAKSCLEYVSEACKSRLLAMGIDPNWIK